MFSLRLAFFTLLIALGQSSSPEARAPLKRLFPQWLTGIIAVTIFLFLVLVIYAVNRYWEHRSQANTLLVSETKHMDMEEVVSNGTYSLKIENVRSQEHVHAYENPQEVTDNVLTTPM